MSPDELEEMWQRCKHEGGDPPAGGMTRLDVSVTLNLAELEEMRNLLVMDDNKPRQDNFSLSDDTANPIKRGRVLRKQGRIFKLLHASMYGGLTFLSPFFFSPSYIFFFQNRMEEHLDDMVH